MLQLVAHTTELSKAMDDCSRQTQAVLTSFMENVATRGVELEAAAARLDQFRGLPAIRARPNVNDGPLAHAPPNADQAKIAAAAERAVAVAAERAVAARLHVENDEAYKSQSGRAIALVTAEPTA